ncbi:uncharacterized protein LOC119660030 [Hermetia illucens]|uniref:uncharacterized protein LOC119660030 n=1 Tax=Hermetia illucens TaxID=343691 RepID=UPI0018CC1E19|nr:uncharacterized protein LOC119660030 [Hermetia illucens]
MSPKQRQLTEEEKGRIVGLSESGKSQREIVRIFKKSDVEVSRSGVQQVLRRKQASGSVARKKGSGRPRKMNSRNTRALQKHALRNRKSSIAQISKDFVPASGNLFVYFGFLRFSNLKFQKNKLKDHESNYALTILDTIELGAL